MNENKQVKNPRKKLSRSALVLIIGLFIIGIPLLVYGGILLQAQLQTGTPIFGDRFVGDLDPAITDSQMSELETELGSLSKAESVNIELTSAQMRVNIDTVDSITTEDLEAIIKEAYDIVNKKLPISTYFTSTDSKKMYDLAINAYNYIDSEDEGMNYVLLTKNAMMSNYSIQVVSEPLDSELASELRGETPSSTAEPEPTETAEAEAE